MENEVMDYGEFYISYNPDPRFSSLPLFDSDDGAETALVKDGKFFILNGDFREAYKHLASEGFEACKKFYDQQATHARSSWSEGNE